MKNLSLSQDQVQFLQHHSISSEKLFDAFGLKKAEYRIKMKELGKEVAYNVTPCKKLGHTLRDRTGHCCQCSTHSLAYQKRSNQSGFVYIAYSKTAKITKVGFTESILGRLESLNRTKYADVKDWEILFSIESQSAGKIEERFKSELKDSSISFEYYHGAKNIASGETFNSQPIDIKDALLKFLSREKFVFKVALNRIGMK